MLIPSRHRAPGDPELLQFWNWESDMVYNNIDHYLRSYPAVLLSLSLLQTNFIVLNKGTKVKIFHRKASIILAYPKLLDVGSVYLVGSFKGRFLTFVLAVDL